MLRPTLNANEVPSFTASDWVQEIDNALNAVPLRHRGTFHDRWFDMNDAARLAWVVRRKAVLTVVWVRGGTAGLQGLGQHLSQALCDIDR